jgi:hypothetical protein
MARLPQPPKKPRENPATEPPASSAAGFGTLISLAQALRDNPWYLSSVLVIYLDGFLITSLILRTEGIRVWVVPELAYGLGWTCFMSIVITGSLHKYLPFNKERARYLLIACLSGAPGTLIPFVLLSVAAKRGLDAIASEVGRIYGHDYHLVSLLLAPALGIALSVFVLYTLVKVARAAMSRV